MTKKSEIQFRARKLFTECTFEKGLNMASDALQVGIEDEKLLTRVQMLLNIATLEEEVHDDPVNIFTRMGARWQKIKNRNRFLRRWFPVKYDRVWAVHKYPEVNIPGELLGQEFVSFRLERVVP